MIHNESFKVFTVARTRGIYIQLHHKATTITQYPQTPIEDEELLKRRSTLQLRVVMQKNATAAGAE